MSKYETYYRPDDMFVEVLFTESFAYGAMAKVIHPQRGECYVRASDLGAHVAKKEGAR